MPTDSSMTTESLTRSGAGAVGPSIQAIRARRRTAGCGGGSNVVGRGKAGWGGFSRGERRRGDEEDVIHALDAVSGGITSPSSIFCIGPREFEAKLGRKVQERRKVRDEK